MKYKVGDKVKIKSLKWYDTSKNRYGEVASFVEGMSKYCGLIATITAASGTCYMIDIDKGVYRWCNYMFDENFKNMEIKKITLPEGWEIDKIENGEIILKESKKELPKTWEECCKQLGKGEYIRSSDSTIAQLSDCSQIEADERNIVPVGLAKPLLALHQLLVCRDVYRQGWRPNWKYPSDKYCIYTINNSISTVVNTFDQKILSFQSREVRDQFLENFRDLIEEAKELI